MGGGAYLGLRSTRDNKDSRDIKDEKNDTGTWSLSLASLLSLFGALYPHWHRLTTVVLPPMHILNPTTLPWLEPVSDEQYRAI
jgi:hypothetical protein